MLLRALFKPLAVPAPDLTAHVEGVPCGNEKGAYEQEVGHLPDGRSTAARSTGISVSAHEPILPQMPNLSPP